MRGIKRCGSMEGKNCLAGVAEVTERIFWRERGELTEETEDEIAWI